MRDYSYAISPTIGIALSSIIVYYLYSLEKLGCQCSLTGKRTYILGFNSALIAFNAFILLMGGIEGVVALYKKFPVLYIVPVAILVGTIANVIFTLEFIDEMKRKGCACSDSVYRDIMYILAIFQAVTWSILGLVILVVGGLFAKDLATGRVTMKNIEAAQKLYKKAAKK
jgi:hypothetical protein